MTEQPPWGTPPEPYQQPGQSYGGQPYGGQPQQPPVQPQQGQGYYGQPGQQGQSGQSWPGQGDPYASQPSYGGYSEQGNYPGQQPAQPYLERDPYQQLSAGNLDQGAYQQQQPGYGQQPQYPYPGGGNAAYPQQQPGGYQPPRSNGLALAGAIVCFIPVLGLILSIIGRARANSLGGAGKVAGNVGIVLSLLFTGGAGFAVYKIGNSTAADPACISAEADTVKLTSTLNADAQALQDAESSGDSAKLQSAGQKFISDMRNLQQQLEAAQAKATHDNVRQAIQTFDTDLGTFLTGLQKVLSGDSSGGTAVTQTADKLQTDGDAVDNLCGNVGNG